MKSCCSNCMHFWLWHVFCDNGNTEFPNE